MAVESGWAYVIGTEASGPPGSIQFAGQDTRFDHDAKLVWSEADEALVVSGNIIAKNFEIQSQTTTVVHLNVTGSSKFGDTPDDEHQFTGSISLTGDLDAAGDITAVNFYGNASGMIGVAVNTYQSQSVNHIVLGAGSKAIRTETNLSYDSGNLYVTGAIQTNELSSSNSVSSQSGYFTNLETFSIVNGNTRINTDSIETPTLNTTTVNALNLGGTLTTAAQPNVTSLGTLTSLNVQNEAKVNGSLAVGTTSASRKVEIKDTNPQLRLTNTDEIFGLTAHTYADFHVTSTGDLSLLPSSGKVIIPSLNLTNVQQGQSNVALSIDANGNVITTNIVQSGIEVRNRRVATTDYQVQSDDYFVAIKAAEDLIITMPDATSLLEGQILVITDEDARAEDFTLTIRAKAGQLIAGRAELTMVSPRASLSFYTDGQSNFFIF